MAERDHQRRMADLVRGRLGRPQDRHPRIQVGLAHTVGNLWVPKTYATRRYS
jgi:hypothetical protein